MQLLGNHRTNAWTGVSGRAYQLNAQRLVVAFALWSALIWLLLLAAPAVLCAEPVNPDFPESPFVAVSRAVRPAVVNIRISRQVTDAGVGTGPLQEMYRQFFPDKEGRGNRFEMPSTGSGFLVRDNGEILTNNHVVDGADAIFVRFSGEKVEYRAELIGTDPNTDLALLRIEAGERELPVLDFADSDAVEVGSWSVAVGNPFGNLESSLTVGVISAKGRGGLVISGGGPRYQDFIQTDASINQGNSGGPLVDINGLVIGVNTAINSRGQGIGFAVPSNLVLQVYGQLREHGRVIRGYLGVVTEDVVQIVGEENPDEPETGARVVSVLPDGPAMAAGLLPGDIIVGFAGQAVESQRQLQFLIAAAAPGQDVACEIYRDGVRKGLRVRPVEWTQEESDGSGDEAQLWLGMEVASLDGTDPRVARLREVMDVTTATGVMVVGVRDGRPAANAGIHPGDILVSIEGREILDLDTYHEVQSLVEARHVPVTVLIRTGSVETYVTIDPDRGGVEN